MDSFFVGVKRSKNDQGQGRNLEVDRDEERCDAMTEDVSRPARGLCLR